MSKELFAFLAFALSFGVSTISLFVTHPKAIPVALALLALGFAALYLPSG